MKKNRTKYMENEIYIEGYGGTVPWVRFPPNRRRCYGTLDMMLLVAEVGELKKRFGKNEGNSY